MCLYLGFDSKTPILGFYNLATHLTYFFYFAESRSLSVRWSGKQIEVCSIFERFLKIIIFQESTEKVAIWRRLQLMKMTTLAVLYNLTLPGMQKEQLMHMSCQILITQ